MPITPSWRCIRRVALLAALVLLGMPDTVSGQPRRPGARPAAPVEEAAPAEPEPAAPIDPADLEPVHDPFAQVRQPGAAEDFGSWPRRSLSAEAGQHVVASPDRWRLGWLPWDRYGRQHPLDATFQNAGGGDSPYTPSSLFNPYDRNVLKGDYPLVTTERGDDIFLNVSGISDTFVQFRELPTPSGPSAADLGAFDFFGDGAQRFISQTFLLNIDLFQGYTAFRPVDWLVRVAPVYNFNYLDLQEKNNVDIDVRRGTNRDDDFATLQEAFFEYHVGDVSHRYDIIAARIGRQLFVSDFRGFIYSDIGDGVRLFGNLASNRVQYNLAFFNQNDKDTNSGLSELDWRDQQVLIANLYVQDFIWMGYTTQLSFHWNHDQSDRKYDDNGFQVIPDLAGSNTLHNIDAYYLGWAGDGHIGRLNVNHAFYYVFGHDDANPIAGREVDISAFMAAVELSVDIDWFRPKVSVLYASGDDDPEDGTAGGFDGIVDNPFFAGGPSSFYQGQALRLFGVNLVSARSFYNDLAGARGEGQSNHVNPGTIVLNAGFDAEITPKLRGSVNYNHVRLAESETLELFLNQNDINHHLGDEINMLLQYRPWLNNNIILNVGGSVFFPGQGFEDIYDTYDTLYQAFVGLTLTY